MISCTSFLYLSYKAKIPIDFYFKQYRFFYNLIFYKEFMLGYEKAQTSLNREQKQAVGILSIGTFLEYFDLMIYVHMAVLLNELFFPKGNPRVAALLAATAFCTTYAVMLATEVK